MFSTSGILPRLFKPLKSPFLLLGNTTLKIVILPVFEKYLWLKNKFAKKTSNKFEKIILALTNHYITHIIIITLAILVTSSNILAYENKEGYGKNALIYQAIGLENIEIIEDTAIIKNEAIVYSYLDEETSVESGVYTESQKLEEEIYEQEHESDASTLQGGTALVKPDLASTEAAKITRTSIREYEVQEGESIGTIANNYNISVNTLLWANSLTSRSIIKPGQKIIIPPTSGVLHTVKNGDTLIRIANKYEADVNKIKEFNNIDTDNLLAIGDTIMIPGGRIIYTAPPRTYTTPTYSTPTYTTPNVASGGQMYWPSSCRRISQYYRGWLHTGLDIACPYGTEIRAAETGRVVRVQYITYGYGYNVIIDHGGGKQTLYGHLSRIYVKEGQQVKKAEIIALEGSTGRSTGPHLHFEVRINGSRLNPLNYLK